MDRGYDKFNLLESIAFVVLFVGLSALYAKFFYPSVWRFLDGFLTESEAKLVARTGGTLPILALLLAAHSRYKLRNRR